MSSATLLEFIFPAPHQRLAWLSRSACTIMQHRSLINSDTGGSKCVYYTKGVGRGADCLADQRLTLPNAMLGDRQNRKPQTNASLNQRPSMGVVFENKLASVIASRIARDILKRGWPVGENLGIEQKLLKRLGVSREPFREAVRILEWQGIVRAERGARGGLIIQAPALTGASNILKTYLELADVSYDEVREVHSLLLHFALRSAVMRMTPAHANGIRKELQGRRSGFRSRDEEGMAVGHIYNAIVGIVDNPSLSLFEFVLMRVTADFGHQERYPAADWKAMIAPVWDIAERMAICIAKSDLDGALRALSEERRLVDDTVRRLERYNYRVWNTRSFLRGAYHSATLDRAGGDKAATSLVYRITADVRRNQLVPGTTLGAETKLIKKLKVSRAVFREAVRTLEFFGIATVKRGGAGGLTVTVPNPSSTIETVVLYLRYMQPDTTQLTTLLSYLEREAIRLAASRASHSELMSLVKAAEIASHSDAKNIYALSLQAKRRLIALAENRVMELVITILAAALAEAAQIPSPSNIARERTALRAICRKVEQVAAGRSQQDLDDALCELHAELVRITDAH